MIKIRVVSHRGRPPAIPQEVCLDETGGTMGRLETNQVVLPDPERHVSRVHARIVHRPDGYFILHQGSNPILLNGTKLRLGDQAPLNDGDELVVSTYRLQVAVPGPVAGDDNPVPSDDSPGLGPPGQPGSAGGVFASGADGRDGASPPLAAQLSPAQSMEESSAPVGAVDFDIDAALAGDADGGDSPSARAELFFSWETDMSWHRGKPEGPAPVEALVTGVATSVRGSDLDRLDHTGDSTSELASEAEVGNCTTDRTPLQPQPSQSAGDTVSLANPSARAAIEGALRRFNPEHLEQRLKQRSLLDSVLSINRKAKLWDLFAGIYPQIVREAREEICRAVIKEPLTPRGAQMSAANTEEGGS